MSTPSASEIRSALTTFIAASATRDSAKIAAALARVTELQRELGDSAHPMLRHYLERRSYQKALDFLNSGQPETGTPQCGH
jgi:hypothetical protein